MLSGSLPLGDANSKKFEKKTTVFSGYDCDSLAFDKLSGFADQALSFFNGLSNVELELRTKSIAIGSLLQREPLSNCIVAFSLSPAQIAGSLDTKAPSINRRISAIKQLANAGWKIGLRFDPLIYTSDWKELYSALFADIMNSNKSTHLWNILNLSDGRKVAKNIFQKHDQINLRKQIH